MFQLYYDTRSDALAETLARLLAQAGSARPLQPRTVLVPHLGLERWLTRTLAERHGIAANIDFIAPAQFAWRLLRGWQPDLPSRSPFDRDVLLWRLYELLPRVARKDTNLRQLLEGQQPQLRLLQLAGQFAHLFERYQAYRPDVLDGWARGGASEDSQARLWRALVDGSDVPPRSRLMTDFIRSFGADGAERPAALPEHVFAYGCINVSPQVLALLGVVSRHAQLHFLMATPCREYWGDLPHRRRLAEYLDAFADGFLDQTAPNRLLVSLGGVGREFVAQVFADDAVQQHSADGIESEPPRDTLLERVQADIIMLAQPDPAQRHNVPDRADSSIHVQVCHSPLREVQVLHDHLLDLLARDPTLEPRDIVVMAPDVGRYAAPVEAVFGAIDEPDRRYLPWTVADRSAADAHPLTALFTRLLSLPATRLSLDLVLQVLEVPEVQQSAGLEGADLNHLKAMAFEAGIRWGEDAADREAQGLPAFDDFSFSFGRRRLLLGYMLGDGEDDTLVDGIAPLSDIEGGIAHAFGEMIRLERQLHELRGAMQVPRTPQQWQDLFNTHLGRMLEVADDDRDSARALADIRQAVAGMVEDSGAADFDQPLDWTCVRDVLVGRLAESRPGQRFLDGGVSVCSMVPMRDVPFRVVCVLGLDADAFPRRDDADVLSLIRRDAERGARRLGDRSVREDDRYLFLQTIMAARQKLYLSYTGIDLQSGRDREPSVLLSEFIEHVCQGYFTDTEKAREALVTKQPMHPFSPRLFHAADDDKDSRQVFTYRHEWQDAAEQSGGNAALDPFVNTVWPAQAPEVRIDLAQMKRFFAAPQRAFLQQQLGLAITDIDEEVGREPLVLDRLHESYMQRQLLDSLLNRIDDSDEQTIRRLRAQALLPPLIVGEQAYKDAHDEIAPQAWDWLAWAGADNPRGEQRTVELDLADAGVLYGTVNGVCEHGFAGWVGRAGSVRRWFNWWLDALAFRAAIDDAGECRAFGINQKSAKLDLPMTIQMPDRQAARGELAKLALLMREGLQHPLLLPPRSGWVMARVLAKAERGDSIKGDPIDRAVSDAAAVWHDRDWPESRDAWIATVLRGREPFVDAQSVPAKRCLELARSMYLPVWTALLGKGKHGQA